MTETLKVFLSVAQKDSASEALSEPTGPKSQASAVATNAPNSPKNLFKIPVSLLPGPCTLTRSRTDRGPVSIVVRIHS